MKEIIKFGCQLLKVNEIPNDSTPEKRFDYYKMHKKDLFFYGVQTKISSIDWQYGHGKKDTIIIKVERL